MEPIQTATSLEGQVEELRTILEKHGNIPVTLIGFSWGAWLSFILAAHYPGMIKKLILVGSGSFEEKYVARLYKTRFSRLDKEEKAEFEFIASAMGDAAELRRSGKLLEFGKLIKCPVVAIHGDYDPHPAEGVQKPLSASLESFRFFLLQNCGHMPWIERQARDKFYSILKAELG